MEIIVVDSFGAIVGYIAGAFGFIAFLVAAFMVTRSTTIKQNVENQKGFIDTLTLEVAYLKAQDIVKTKQIADLTQELAVFKDVPLTEIVNTQKEILTILREMRDQK